MFLIRHFFKLNIVEAYGWMNLNFHFSWKQHFLSRFTRLWIKKHFPVIRLCRNWLKVIVENLSTSTLSFLSLKVVSATFGPITMFKEQSLSFHVVFKIFITQNYLFVIPNNIRHFTCLYHSCLAHFKVRDNRGTHNFEKQCYCGNYSDDVCQCLNTDQILLNIQYFDDSIL